MVYTYISSKYIIPEIYSYFNVKTSGWEDYVPYWVADCLHRLRVYSAYVVTDKNVEVIEYKAEVPIICRRIKAVFAINTLGEYRRLKYSSVGYEGQHLYKDEYSIDKNFLNVGIKNGIIKLFFDSLPVEEDCDTGRVFPVIPNVEDLKEALRQYIMSKILQRGYVHEVMNLRDNNPYTNPGMAFDKLVPRVRIRCGTMHSDMRDDIARQMVTFYKTNNVGRGFPPKVKGHSLASHFIIAEDEAFNIEDWKDKFRDILGN
jgi:hypothetical protein